MIKALLIISTTIIIGLTGCATTATITDPQGNVYTYKGPKGVDMSVKKGDSETKYSGKTQPWWHGLLGVIIGKSPDVTVVK